MAKEIHVSWKSSRREHWVSFENDPYLSTVKKRVRYRCFPCIENLYHQLVEGKQEIQLGPAFHCWKVVVVLDNEKECFQVLMKYEQKFLPSRHIYGRFGSKKESGTKAIVVNADTEQERDILLSELAECINETNLKGKIFYSKACAYLYEELLGEWREWKEITPLKYPGKAKEIIERVKELLEFS